jgi:hypothetical protein
LKDRIKELQSNSKNKNIRELYRGINEFKKGYQPRTNLVKDERGDLLVDPHKILNRWKNYFCQLLNLRGAGGVRQTEIRTVELLVPQPSASEFEVVIGKLRRKNLQVLIRFQQNHFRQAGKHCVQVFISLLS